MTVGETLTEARCQAGLSVDELSKRTRIRGTVIRSIERDDYEACGGDLYVRGYVRAIAGAVGIDAQPLIREYDRSRASRESGTNGISPPAEPDVTTFDLLPVAPAEPAVTAVSPASPGGPVYPGGPEVSADLAATRFDLPVVAADPAATRFDLPPVRESVGENLMTAGYEVSPEAVLAHNAAPGARRPARHSGPVLAGITGVLLLAVVGAVGVHLASAAGQNRNGAAASATRAVPSMGAGAAGIANGAAPVTSATSAKPGSTPSTVVPVTTLPIAAAEAYGPDGLTDGDNPQIANFAIDPGTARPWATQWYTTADFGLLKHGTGLLLDLGGRATITRVRVDLARYQGVNLRLRAGDGTAPRDLRVVASAQDTGGVVRLTLGHPVSARYLLIWFTLLPPNGSGHYQESVYRVLVRGQR